MLSSILLGIALVAPPKFDFFNMGPYESGVPHPEQVLGYTLGSRHTVYRDLERVGKSIANAAKGRVVEIEFGHSTEGRPLRVFVISSSANIKNLEQIRQNNLKLANPFDGNLDAIAKSNPAIVWINQGIHGDETASYESGMALLYTLAASRNRRISEILDRTVVILNPHYNPDGHERYVVAYNSIPNGHAEPGSYDTAIPSAFFGRTNHYRFDMNRDRMSMSQAETRNEVAEFLRWMPQVYVDQHGQVETYFFPPVQQSVNANVDRKRYNSWTEVLGRATASAFDQQGWQYYIKDQFDFFNPCYLDTHSTLMGAIGITHETDGGRVLARKRSDETILTMRDGAAKHFVSALAVIESASKSKAQLLESYLAFKRSAVSGDHAGKFRRVVMTSEDSRELARFARHLDRTGIKYKFADKSWNQSDAHDYWSDRVGAQLFPAGSLVVDIAQPMGHLAKTWLEPGSDFEPDFVARQKQLAKVEKEGKGESEIDSYEFYDGTAWCQIYAYNLKAWWCESAPTISHAGLPGREAAVPQSTVGFYQIYSDVEDILFAARALQNGFKVSLNRRSLKVGGVTIPRGSFLYLAARNQDGYDRKIADMANRSGIKLLALTTSYPDEGRDGPGSESIVQLRKPNIGIVMGNAGNLGGGALWYLMEQEFKLPFTAITTTAMNGNLDRFTTIVLASGSGTTTGRFGDWIRAGGCAVSLSNPGWALGQSGFANLESRESEPDLPGSQFKAEMDPRSFLSYGYPAPAQGPITIAVPVDGSQFYEAPESGSAVMLSSDEKVRKLLSGWEWDTTEKDLTGTAWLVDAPAGQGRAVLFTQDPTHRAQYPGLYKMLLNAMILGPSM